MKNIFSILIFLFTVLFLFSCGSYHHKGSYKKKASKRNYTTYSKPRSNETKSTNVYRSSNTYSSTSREVNKLLKVAKSYLGSPYKFGGTTKKGFDCSGLVYVSFKELSLELPRISRDQANYGKEIRIDEVKLGDLIFFNTSGKAISHVGIVESIESGGIIHFIHSSTSKGVMISSLDDNYWKARFVKAIRLL